jgi:hypothetical protein
MSATRRVAVETLLRILLIKILNTGAGTILFSFEPRALPALTTLTTQSG